MGIIDNCDTRRLLLITQILCWLVSTDFPQFTNKFFWNLGPRLGNPLCKQLTRWSQKVAILWVGWCVQRPFFEEVTEESLETLLISTSRGWAFGVIQPSIMSHLSSGCFALWALTFLSKWPRNASSTNLTGSFIVPSSTPTSGKNTFLGYSSVWSPLELAVGDKVMWNSSVDGYSFPHLSLTLWWISYVTVPFLPQGFPLGAGFALKITKGMP